MNAAVTPDQMDAMAEQLESTARSLRDAAAMIRAGGAMKPLNAAPYPPKVLETAERILRQTGKPLHVTELFERVRGAGAFVRDHYNLSSMLSKDKQRTFRPAPGQRGFWELIKS